MREDGTGLADPVGVFMSGARVGGNVGPTRGGSFPLALFVKENEVANLDDSSLMEKGWSARYCRKGTPDRASPKISVF